MPAQVSPRLTVLAFILLAALIATGGALLLQARPEPTTITIYPPPPTAMPAPTATPGPILVYVTGAVVQPETVYELPHKSRVADALAAAGGLLESANLTLVNLAGRLRDGDQIHVPRLNSDAEENKLPTPMGGRRVYINTATQAELEALPGIGPALAGRIIEYRTQVGEFSSLADLDAVSGIGQALLARLRDVIAFD